MKVINKTILKEAKDALITRIAIHAPLVAEKAKAGQFVVLMVSEQGERIPLTVVDSNKDTGEIVLIFQELGFTTRLLGKVQAGDSLYSLVGPLGHPTEIKNFGKVILVGGGVGIAEIYPVAKAFKQAGNYVCTILGARTKELLILEDELKSVSDETLIATDDGSYGEKGFTTDILKRLLATGSPSTRPPKADELGTPCGRKLQAPSLVYAVGPIPMMKRVAAVTNEFRVRTIVSLNALMVDATGMCGCCRVTVGGETKFSCVDGPEFDGHGVDWGELEKRNRIYCDKEKHICNLNTNLHE